MAKYIGVVTGRRILLSNADNVPVELVQNDKDTTVIDFELSKIDYVADLSQLNVAINYVNIDKDTGESVTDIYTVDNPTIEGDSLKFSWTVGSNASVYAGKCVFQLVLTLTDANDVITQQWDSTKQSIEVHASLENVNVTQPKSFVDLVSQIKKSVSDAVASGITDDRIKQIVEQHFEENPVQVITDNTLSVAGTPADALATGTAVDSLKGDLDTLNQGGLNLKEDFIGQQVNEWLDEHPEATTTVQDGAITEPKIHAEFLPYIKNEYVTPEMFGAVGDGVTDDTEAIQSAINTKKPIHFGRKTYCATHLTIKNATKLIGERGKTVLKSLPSNEESFITMDNGVCQYVTICDLILLGNDSNNNQNGLYLKASFPINTQEYQHGGLWHSDIYNIEIRNFSKVGFALIGGGDTIMLPMQANYFKEIEVSADPNKFNDAIPILIEGQVEQSTFIRMSGSSFPSTGGIVKVACMMRRKRNGNIIDGDSGGLGNTFIQCYFGNANVGLSMERTWRSAFINCYYENVNTPIMATTSTNGVKIIGAMYSFLSSSQGIFAKCDSNSKIDFIGIIGDGNNTTVIDAPFGIITGGKVKNVGKIEMIADSDTINVSSQNIILHSSHDLKKIISSQQFINIQFTQVTNIINGSDIITISRQNVECNYGVANFIKVSENKYLMVYPN